jgi:hypothetical protein
VLWSPDLKQFYEYTPRIPNHHLLIPPIVFDGVVKVTNAAQQHCR